MKPQKIKWTTEKPVLKEEGILLTSTHIRGQWDYECYEISLIEFDGQCYYGICDLFGDEWGDYEDFTAERYCFLKP